VTTATLVAVQYVFCARARCKKHKGTKKNCVGELTGAERLCGLEGCGGVRLVVRWPGGKITWPCVKGMKLTPKGWQIL